MATAKKVAAKKDAATTPVETPKTKTAVAKKATAKAVPAEDAEERPLSQKEQVIQAAAEGLTINEIVEKYGFKKTNVSWYFSKHKLHPVKAPAAPAPVAKTATKATTKSKASK